MRILILGGDGMLGHQLFQHLSQKYEVTATLHKSAQFYDKYSIYKNNVCFDIDVRSNDSLLEVVSEIKPDVIINATGIIKQRKEAKEYLISLEVNSLLPHRLSIISKAVNARLIHMSTDCVFSGAKGSYTENDISDATDLYGRSKYLGEVKDGHCITLRTSIIGLELFRKLSLIEWFLDQRGTIKGYKNSIYTGLTTIEMSRVIDFIISNKPDLSGLWHVASEPISKYDLLSILNKKLERNDIDIVEDTEVIIDRSLNAAKFRDRTGYCVPEWDKMLEELAQVIKNRKKINEAR